MPVAPLFSLLEGFLASGQEHPQFEGAGGVSLDALRRRLYKAIRTAILENEEAQARESALERWLTALGSEEPRERTFPEELTEAQHSAIQAGLERAVSRCRRLAGDWFTWDPLAEWAREFAKAVAQVSQEDEAALRLSGRQDLGEADLTRVLRHQLRQRWCGDPTAPETFRLEEWLEEVGFCSRELLEIGSWTRIFHTIARLYREGLAAPTARQAELHRLADRVKQGQALGSLPELVIYLEGYVRDEGSFPGPIPPPLEPDLFPGQDREAIIPLFLEALRFLRNAEAEPALKRRLAWLEERRDLIDLKDLLVLFLKTIRKKEALPAPSEVLDYLQLRGFPIRHKDFRDDYRAPLAPLAALAQTCRLTVRWPLDLARLSGDPGRDLDVTGEREERRRQTLQAFKEEVSDFLTGRGLPLPQAELIRPAARFVVAWLACRACLGGEPLDAQALAQEASQLLPPALLKLIRPRKGYELTHKRELSRFLLQEAELYQEALGRWRRLGRISNFYEDGLIVRLACVHALQQRQPDLTALTAEAALSLEMEPVNLALDDLAGRLALDLAPAGAPYWHEFKAWLKDRLGWPSLPAQEESGVPAEVWERSTTRLFNDLARQLYRLVVARARRRAHLPPLPGDPDLLAWLAAFLTPEQAALRQWVGQQLLGQLEERARCAVWESYPLAVETPEEFSSLLKYYLAQELKGQELESYARHQKVSELPERLRRRLERLRLPADIMPPGGLDAALQALLRPRAPEATQAQRQLEEKLLALLPRSDCGSCGVPGCLAFARLLIQGRAQVAQCLQSPDEVKNRLEQDLAQVPAAALAQEPYLLNEDDCRRLTYLLDPYFMALRHRVGQELAQSEGHGLVPLRSEEISILQIGKSPYPATFHQYLADYLGEEAAGRLTTQDRAFLVEYGDLRLAAEAREMEESFSWLAQEIRSGLSVFALGPKDPAEQARQAYGGCLFLCDLTAADQARVREFRLRRFLADFLADWERALPEHWQAGYLIEDWEDFAQIIGKSYWHQEHTPAPGEILRELSAEISQSRLATELARVYLEDLVREETSRLEECRQRLEALLRSRRVTSLAEVNFLIEGLIRQGWQELAGPGRLAPGAASGRLSRLMETVFGELDQANLDISGGLRVHGDELSPRVREILAASSEIAPGELARLQPGGAGLAWREMQTLQPAWLKAQIQVAAERLLREEREVERFEQGDLPGPTPLTLRRATRHFYWAGVRTLPDLLDTLGTLLSRYLQGRQGLTEATVRRFIWERLRPGAFWKTEAKADPLVKSIDRLLRARFALDVPKLKAYMFLLARMEGNLDKLTALLREIRETSDIIEAAWLAFTEERVAQSRGLVELAAPEEHIPLLASRLPDKERLNRYLTDGLPRGEPREYAQAYGELITLLQFYVVTASPQDPPEEILHRLESAPYELGGLSREALLSALKHQAQHREGLLPGKITICTYILAHRLSAANPRLAQSAAAFLQQKSAFLKEEVLRTQLSTGQLAGDRGLELAKVKNELYLQISDLLKEERTESFARRIGQIIDRLEEERQATLASFQRGRLDRKTAFYILRRWQKDQPRVTAADLGRFLRQYQPETLARLRARLAPPVVAEVDQRLKDMLAHYQAALMS